MQREEGRRIGTDANAPEAFPFFFVRFCAFRVLVVSFSCRSGGSLTRGYWALAASASTEVVISKPMSRSIA